MIYAVTGLLGGGKSLYCVQLMGAHLAAGGVVVTNIHLYLDQIQKDLRFVLHAKQYTEVDLDNLSPWAIPHGDARGMGSRRVMLVIDEAAEWLDSYSNTQFKDWDSFFRHSDKAGIDVYLIVQDASMLFKRGRVLCHRWVYVANLGQFKFPGIRVGLPPPGLK